MALQPQGRRLKAKAIVLFKLLSGYRKSVIGYPNPIDGGHGKAMGGFKVKGLGAEPRPHPLELGGDGDRYGVGDLLLGG